MRQTAAGRIPSNLGTWLIACTLALALSGCRFDDKPNARASTTPPTTRLVGTNFTGANLTGASFVGARMFSTNLTGANLSGVNFTGALVNGATIFTGASYDATTVLPSGQTAAQLATMTFVAEPATALLLLAGLGGLVALGSSRRDATTRT